MKRFTQLLTLALTAAALTGCCATDDSASTTTATQGTQKNRPTLFASFGDHVNVPDGLTADKQGNIFLSVPNYVNPAYPASILKRDAQTGRWSVFTTALTHPVTKLAAPMGIEAGEDGNLYYCDNQYFFNKNYHSRVMRVVINKAGEPVRIEPVIENIKLANAIRLRDGAIYFTDTFFDLAGKNLGGVYRVPFSAFKDKPARILPKEQYEKDPYLLGVTETVILPHRNDAAGADGMCFDTDGNIYTGTFGSGRFYTLKRKADGTYEKPSILFDDPARLPCVDGITYYAKKHWVIITDSEQNAVHYWDIKSGKLGTLWKNEDTDGADGLLDQPCEPLVIDGKLIIVNFDYTFPGLKNKKNDSVHTLSVLELP
ncbi:MAG: SMP-30/gluconolactonase/LRE family protein [Puniceicoccales bacterium]|nr:SMP-30/gluconolactonase/LRE family protein [Puniceicoccales bacterium]